MRKIHFFLWYVVAACAFSPLFADIAVQVKEDIYVLPVAELASTKTYPDIIEIENEKIIVQILPNRGRVLSNYTLKSKGSSLLYQELQPKPMLLPGGLHSVEFGGYYLSLPWNTRDRQPFDLDFEITESGPERAEVYLTGKDMFKRTLTECWVRISEGSPVVEVEIRITNTSSRKPREIDFSDFWVVSVGPDSQEDANVLLPVDAVIVEQSTDNWLGSTGTPLQWTSEAGSWENMRQFFEVRTDGELKTPCVSILYPRSRTAFMKFWESDTLFENIRLRSWGRTYKKIAGAAAYLVVSTGTNPFTLQPEESVSFTLYMTAVTGIRESSSLQDIYERVRSGKGK